MDQSEGSKSQQLNWREIQTDVNIVKVLLFFWCNNLFQIFLEALWASPMLACGDL